MVGLITSPDSPQLANPIDFNVEDEGPTWNERGVLPLVKVSIGKTVRKIREVWKERFLCNRVEFTKMSQIKETTIWSGYKTAEKKKYMYRAFD